MVFWSIYPGFCYATSLFTPCIIHKAPLPSPTGHSIKRVNTMEEATEVRQFLRCYFGSPPRTPVLDIPESYLLEPADDLFIVRDDSKELAGCIRYHVLGHFLPSQKPISIVDGFCIHPQWRKKGLGDYLLTELHRYQKEKPFALFLKEGPSLSLFPHYSGQYVYRRLSYMPSTYLHAISAKCARQLITIHLQFQPDLFVICPNHGRNQQWFLYKMGLTSVVACVQDTFQRIKGERMGWVTAWLESPSITEDDRALASEAIAGACYSSYAYLWMNRLWVGSAKDWKADGGFHWYTYQWSTTATMGISYAVIS